VGPTWLLVHAAKKLIHFLKLALRPRLPPNEPAQHTDLVRSTLPSSTSPPEPSRRFARVRQRAGSSFPYLEPFHCGNQSGGLHLRPSVFARRGSQRSVILAFGSGGRFRNSALSICESAGSVSDIAMFHRRSCRDTLTYQPSLTCHTPRPKISARYDRPNSLSLSHHRETRWGRNGSRIQGRGH